MVKLNKKNLKKVCLLLLFITTAGSFAFRDDLFLASKNLDIFTSLYKELNLNYVDSINSTRLVQTGIDAMLTGLDPYTQYIPESGLEDYKLQYISTRYGGIGAAIFIRKNQAILSDIYENFPAQKAGIHAGDELLQINHIPLKGKSNNEISQLLKGPKNSSVTLLIQRPGLPKPIEKKLIREEIIQPNVPYYGMLNNHVGYIKLDKFLENSGKEVKDALNALQKNNLNGLVLDLRYNGGGILQEAVKIVNLFVDKNVLVVTQKARDAEKTVSYRTTLPALAPNLPLVVLINSHSASAAEIVAGSLQDLDRAVIVGQRSFGKGLVQQTFNLPYNALVKITVAKYYTPSGRCIQELDYAHKNTDGSPEKVASSSITAFKTKSGRQVYDGSGIYPDIYIKPFTFSPVTQSIAADFLIFDYATRFRNKNASIGNPKNFKLTDKQYNDFLKYLSDKGFVYKTGTGQILSELAEEAEKENQLGELKNELNALRTKVSNLKNNDLQQHRDEISRVLASEIVSRYYFQRGRLEYSFQSDKDLNKAIDILNSKALTSSILEGRGTFGSIGKPRAGNFSANSGK